MTAAREKRSLDWTKPDRRRLPGRPMPQLLWTVASVLVVLWAIEFFVFRLPVWSVHVLLLAAVVTVAVNLVLSRGKAA